MSSNDKNNNLYSASDIQKYLRGELSAPEMHQLERAALEDPFLADALEGMEIYPGLPSARNFQEDLDELQQRMNKRVTPKDRAGLLHFFRPAWRIAAVIILLLGLGVTVYFTFLNQAGKDKLASDSGVAVGTVARPIPAAGTISATDSLVSPSAPPANKPQQEIAKREEIASGNASHLREVEETGKTTGASEEATAKRVNDSRDRTHFSAPANAISPAPANAPPPASVNAPPPAPAHALQAVRLRRLHDKEVAEMVQTNPPFRKQASASSIPDSFKLQSDSAAFSNGLVVQEKQPSHAALDKMSLNRMLLNKQAGLKTSALQQSDQVVFTGRVTDLNNNALSGASLHLNGNYLTRQNGNYLARQNGNYATSQNGNYLASTVTDKYGNFSLTLPKKDSIFKLTVTYVGYEQASVGLNVENRTGNIIQLQPQAASLNEVVVSGYGAKRKEILQDNSEPKKEFFTSRAIPAEGWPAYNSYLETNKKTKNPDSTLKGNETISFIVSKEGLLSSFKVEQSLSPAHDSAAIHLIRQGPSWKLLKGKKARAYVTIPF